jgi:hypothetical protein
VRGELAAELELKLDNLDKLVNDLMAWFERTPVEQVNVDTALAEVRRSIAAHNTVQLKFSLKLKETERYQVTASGSVAQQGAKVGGSVTAGYERNRERTLYQYPPA